MIPIAAITQWQENAPWTISSQVEHDLLLSRILVELFSNNFLSSKLAFRGGTALHKLFIKKAIRFSEDIDLVQLNPEPIGETLGAIHDLINPWMGQPKVKRSEGRATMVYRALSELESIPISIKIEINTRDHDNLLPKLTVPFSVKNKWFNGDAQINTYQLEELMATKLRALYQRKKGRDLFDFFAVIKEVGHLDLKQTITCFEHYMSLCDSRVTKAQFQQNLEQKRKSKIFNADMRALLPSNIIYDYDVERTYKYIFEQILSLLPGEPWKGLN